MSRSGRVAMQDVFLCRREKMDMMNAFAFSMGMGWLPTKTQ